MPARAVRIQEMLLRADVLVYFGRQAVAGRIHFWTARGARQRRPSAGMIAPPILARLASGNGARSARGFRERRIALRRRPNASSFSRKLKWRERPLARTTIRVTS